MQRNILVLSFIIISVALIYGFTTGHQNEDSMFTTYIAAPKDIKMYWKRNGRVINTFLRLKLIEPNVAFAMNGGMFNSDYSPVGLYIENGVQLKPITISHNSNYNYGIQPQGIFLISDSVPNKDATRTNKVQKHTPHTQAEVITIDQFTSSHVKYATESAPMLIIKGKVNPALPKGTSATIRNGVGILPNGNVLMAVSKDGITFQDFASFFQRKGCSNALYLDGGISAAYTGQDRTDGNFGVMIGVVKGN